MKPFWDWIWYLVFAIVIIKAFCRIFDSFNLLNDLSDDINDIKKKWEIRVTQ